MLYNFPIFLEKFKTKEMRENKNIIVFAYIYNKIKDMSFLKRMYLLF